MDFGPDADLRRLEGVLDMALKREKARPGGCAFEICLYISSIAISTGQTGKDFGFIVRWESVSYEISSRLGA
jgi:hypothetical protein